MHTPGLVGAARGATKQELTIAAASDLTQAFQEVGPAFEKATGIHPAFSFGSTARLSHQIENGAPWDLFAAADTEHIEALLGKRLLEPGSTAVYATGTLALWFPFVAAKTPDALTSPAIRIISLANPDLAPYGRAARETLQNLGIWQRVESKLVFAENTSMAKQYGATGNADAVFTAYALVRSEAGSVVRVEERLHRPIRQALGLLASSRQKASARQFADFVLTGGGHAILRRYGYH